ncbi:hypothetical protein B0H10DRAFT_13032 [Mycena sp. CBHHK59/15]|nr:hypothetical protein B0H10DRAFT_13032 [Mycena sp. CBHHK59/15]
MFVRSASKPSDVQCAVGVDAGWGEGKDKMFQFRDLMIIHRSPRTIGAYNAPECVHSARRRADRWRSTHSRGRFASTAESTSACRGFSSRNRGHCVSALILLVAVGNSDRIPTRNAAPRFCLQYLPPVTCRTATTLMSTTKRQMLSYTHAIFRGLQEDLRKSLKELPFSTPSVLRNGLLEAK